MAPPHRMRKLRVALARAGAYHGAMTDPYHYALIARAIDQIDAADRPLTLDELSARMGLSPAHFQRVFTAWVGVSPKRYQQYLTLTHAKSLLAADTPLLATADSVGLSGPSRLHDLFITWEAMTPGTWAAKGRGLALREITVDSPFGPVVALASDKGVCAIGLAADQGIEATRADLRARWPDATVTAGDAALAAQVEAALTEGAQLRLHAMGGAFQIKVWEALLTIPQGRATTYGALAKAIGSPGAARAVGSAVGANPLSVLIPCHRVLAANGRIGGYHWGLTPKRAILAREAARVEAA